MFLFKYTFLFILSSFMNQIRWTHISTENGATDVQFHVRGNLSDYSSKHIQDIKETVSEIVGCRADEIIIGGFSQSTSFFVHLLIKDAYLLKLSFMSKKEKENLAARNIDFLTFNSDIVRMDCSKEEIKGIVEKDDLPHQAKYQHVRWIDKPAAQPTGNGQLKRNLSEKDSDDSSSDEKHKRLDDNEAPQVMLNTFSSLSQNEEKSNQEELSRSTLPHNSSYGHHSEGPSKVSENLQTWIQTGENVGATYIINHADGNNVEKSNEKPSNKNISDDDMYATSTCTDDTDINNEDDSDSSDCYSEDDSSNFDGDDDLSDNNVSQLISSC